jgi:hypothetical protein
MFTGIVEELGEIVGSEDLGDSARLTIRGRVVTGDARHGDSIAVNGVCLTVVDVLPEGRFTADVMAETLNRSSLAVLAQGSAVNLERAAAVNSRLADVIPDRVELIPARGLSILSVDVLCCCSCCRRCCQGCRIVLHAREDNNGRGVSR